MKQLKSCNVNEESANVPRLLKETFFSRRDWIESNVEHDIEER